MYSPYRFRKSQSNLIPLRHRQISKINQIAPRQPFHHNEEGESTRDRVVLCLIQGCNVQQSGRASAPAFGEVANIDPFEAGARAAFMWRRGRRVFRIVGDSVQVNTNTHSRSE